MRFALTPEQESFRETTRRFLADRVRIRELIERPGAHDPDLWKAMAGMGWLGVDVPESLGGQGSSFVETALLAEEAGAALLPGPMLGTLIAVRAFPSILAAGSAASVVAGRDSAPVRLVRNRLRGEDPAVPCAAVAAVFLVVAGTADGPATFLVRASEAVVEAREGADLTRPIARVRFEGARYEERLDATATEALLDRACVLVAADLVGVATGALEAAVAYAKDRIQFDRPIGSFQAVKHRAADAWRALEAARLMTRYAAWAIANEASEAHVAASAAKAAAGDAAVRCTADSIQIHGGIGFTWEHDAHLYYRRAIAGQAMLGDAASHREVLAADVFARA